jgi:hypothetical protein
MKLMKLIIFALSLIMLTACGNKNPCPEGSVIYLEDISQFPANTSAGQVFDKTDLEIRNKTITFDRVITGPVCNDTWEGTVYVACDLELQKWDIKPFFLTNGCNLEIKPDTVVYVAAHNNSAYYKGCVSCH